MMFRGYFSFCSGISLSGRGHIGWWGYNLGRPCARQITLSAVLMLRPSLKKFLIGNFKFSTVVLMTDTIGKTISVLTGHR